MKKVYSYGGCGCTAFRVALGLPNHAPDKHRRKPPKENPKNPKKIAYIYGDPRNSVLSYLARKTKTHNFPVLHGGNLGVKVPANLNIDNIDKDYFKLEEHFDNWVNWKPTHSSLIIIRYEDIFTNLDKISNFFGKKITLKQKTRKSDYKNQTEEVQNRLNTIYKNLLKKINQLGPVVITTPHTAK